jgi:hypothetical protein
MAEWNLESGFEIPNSSFQTAIRSGLISRYRHFDIYRTQQQNSIEFGIQDCETTADPLNADCKITRFQSVQF